MNTNSPGIIRLFEIIVAQPLLVVCAVGSGVGLSLLAGRLRCYGFLKNLLFGIACAAATFLLFGAAVLLARYANIHSSITAPIVAGFASGAFFVVLCRLLFLPRPPAMPQTPGE